MRRVWGEHQPDEREERCRCGERWMCGGARLAFRGLMNSCTPLLGGGGRA